MSVTEAEFGDLTARIEHLTNLVEGLVTRAPVNHAPPPPSASYSVEDAAKLLGRKPYTVRQWCLEGRINAHKLRGWKRGAHALWRIVPEEIDRINAEGLLPADSGRNKGRFGDR